MVRALLLLQAASAAKEAMDVLTFALYDTNDCSGDVSGFMYVPFAANEAAGECQEDDGSYRKTFCVDGMHGEQKYSDDACTTKSAELETVPNGLCYAPAIKGKFAGCGNHQCEYEAAAEKFVCDHTPEESVYNPPPPPKTAMDAVVLDIYASGDCSGTATRVFYPMPTKLADGDCNDDMKKHYCKDGTPMEQEYSDAACGTKKGDETVVDGCIKEDDGTSRKVPDCGNYKCSAQPMTGMLDCDYVPGSTKDETTKKNNSSDADGAELRALSSAAILAMAGALAA